MLRAALRFEDRVGFLAHEVLKLCGGRVIVNKIDASHSTARAFQQLITLENPP